MTCPACGGADAEDGPGCVCPKWTEADMAAVDARRAELAWFFDGATDTGYAFLRDGEASFVRDGVECDAPELPPAHDVGGDG